jgi:hypothetical protein
LSAFFNLKKRTRRKNAQINILEFENGKKKSTSEFVQIQI